MRFVANKLILEAKWAPFLLHKLQILNMKCTLIINYKYRLAQKKIFLFQVLKHKT